MRVLNGEIQYETEVERLQDRELEAEYLNKYVINNVGKTLFVYIDVPRNKKLITNAVAYSLGLIDYSQFATNDKGFYEVTDEMIKKFESQGIRIEYKYINNEISMFYDVSNGKKLLDIYTAELYGLRIIPYLSKLCEVTDSMIRLLEQRGVKIEYIHINGFISVFKDLKTRKVYIEKKVAIELGLISNKFINVLSYIELTDEMLKNIEQQGYKILYEWRDFQKEYLNIYKNDGNENLVSKNLSDFQKENLNAYKSEENEKRLIRDLSDFQAKKDEIENNFIDKYLNNIKNVQNLKK